MLEILSRGPERRDRWNRGMTKKELSDMALGVRELSKRLGITLPEYKFPNGRWGKDEIESKDGYCDYEET